MLPQSTGDRQTERGHFQASLVNQLLSLKEWKKKSHRSKGRPRWNNRPRFNLRRLCEAWKRTTAAAAAVLLVTLHSENQPACQCITPGSLELSPSSSSACQAFVSSCRGVSLFSPGVQGGGGRRR